MMILLLISSIFIFFCSDVINAALSSHEQTWLTNNPSVTNPQEAAQKAAKKVEFESHGYSDVNLFRTYWKWSQENPQGTWDTFATSSEFRDYNTRQNLIQSLITSGFTDSKWHSSFFSWSSKSNSVDISTWTHSDEYASTQAWLTKKAEVAQNHNLHSDVKFGYYYAWYQNHLNDAHNDVDAWKHSFAYREMNEREAMRTELTNQGFGDNLWFRSCWDWSKRNPGKSISDWKTSYDFVMLQYREQKRAELISHGYSDKKQFNEFWRWFQTSSSFVDPMEPYIISGGEADRWNTLQKASDANVRRAKCRCSAPDLSKGLSICNDGCGNPNTVCNENYGCTDVHKGCRADSCTCKPDGLQGSDYTFTECEQQCARIGMLVPWSQESVFASESTGCNTNSKTMWVNPYHVPVVPTPGPTQRPAVQRYTIRGGMTSYWNGQKTPRMDSEKASCRCSASDGTKGLSVCHEGCGNPNQVCTTDFGCNQREANCNANKCTCNPYGTQANEYTYEECSAQCQRVGMVIPFSEATVGASQDTGCDANNLSIWVNFTPGA